MKKKNQKNIYNLLLTSRKVYDLISYFFDKKNQKVKKKKKF
jgi:hypothetical protein